MYSDLLSKAWNMVVDGWCYTFFTVYREQPRVCLSDPSISSVARDQICEERRGLRWRQNFLANYFVNGAELLNPKIAQMSIFFFLRYFFSYSSCCILLGYCNSFCWSIFTLTFLKTVFWWERDRLPQCRSYRNNLVHLCRSRCRDRPFWTRLGLFCR